MSSHAAASSSAQTVRFEPVMAGYRASTRMRVARFLVILALIPIAVFYLLPRVVNLVATPYRLDDTIVSAGHYNPDLNTVADEEQVTLRELAALDHVSRSLARVRATDAKVAGELKTLIGQIRSDLQPTLNTSVASVGKLLPAIDSLDAQLAALNGPVDGATGAVAADRKHLAAILVSARSTAADVHRARQEADRSARSVAGN